jgi:hypothetical protein
LTAQHCGVLATPGQTTLWRFAGTAMVMAAPAIMVAKMVENCMSKAELNFVKL